MADSDCNLMHESLRTQLLGQLFKYGPSWVLLFALVGFLGYELHSFVGIAGPATAGYITASRKIDEQNAKNVVTLTTAQARTSTEHESMLASLTALQLAIEQRQQEHEGQTETIERMLQLIEEATKTMAVVPGQRAEQIALLKEIKQGIDVLRATVETTNGNEANHEP